MSINDGSHYTMMMAFTCGKFFCHCCHDVHCFWNVHLIFGEWWPEKCSRAPMTIYENSCGMSEWANQNAHRICILVWQLKNKAAKLR